MNKTSKRIIILEENDEGMSKILDTAVKISEEQYNDMVRGFIEGQENIIYAYGEYNEDFCPEDFIDFWKAYQIGFIDGYKLAEDQAKKFTEKDVSIEDFNFEE